jgi:hypothetical protein
MGSKKKTSPLKVDEIHHTSKSKLPCKCQFLNFAKSLRCTGDDQLPYFVTIHD